MYTDRLKQIRVLLLMALGLTACQAQTQDAFMDKLNGILSGKVSMTEFSFIYIEEHPMDWSLEFTLSGANNLAHIVNKSMKPGCQEHWNKDCWLSSEKTRAVSDAQARLIIEHLVNSELTGSKNDSVLAPGAEGVSLKITIQGIAPVNLRIKQQDFTSDLQLKSLRQLILKLAEPVQTGTSEVDR